MRVFITVLILIFSLQSLTKADDIRDFQIEGMSIGDSALDFFSKSILEKNKVLEWYDTKVFTPIAELTLTDSKIYTSFQIAVKSKDKKYKIESISGFVFYKDDVSECYKRIDTISKEIKELFVNIEDLGKQTYKHSYDKTGKSKITDVILRDKNGDEIVIACYDWSDNLPYWDQLRISINTNEYVDWLNVAYN